MPDNVNFDIITYCTENYKACLELFLKYTGNRSGARKIYVYTDGKWDPPRVDHRIETVYVPIFEPSRDWLTNVGRLPEIAYHHVIKSGHVRPFMLLGADCFIVRSIDEIFAMLDDENWIGVFRWGRSDKTLVDVFALKVNLQSRKFIEGWKAISDSFKVAGIGCEEGLAAYDQISYDFLVKTLYADNIVRFKEGLALNEADDELRWRRSVEHFGKAIRGLHFKGGRWKKRDLVEEIMKLAEVNDGEYDVDGERADNPSEIEEKERVLGNSSA